MAEFLVACCVSPLFMISIIGFFWDLDFSLSFWVVNGVDLELSRTSLVLAFFFWRLQCSGGEYHCCWSYNRCEFLSILQCWSDIVDQFLVLFMSCQYMILQMLSADELLGSKSLEFFACLLFWFLVLYLCSCQVQF